MSVTNQLILFHSIFPLNTMQVNRTHQLFCFQHSSKYLFCIKQKKKSHTGLEQLEGKLIMTGF